MRRLIATTLLFAAAELAAANIDGQVDSTFGELNGRTTIGYLDYYTPDVRAFTRYPQNGKITLFADNANDPGVLYLARLLADGTPDPTFGTNNDGRYRVSIPGGLTPQSEGLSVHVAASQSNGKPLFAGGLYASDGDLGAYPGVVCRLVTAGTFDPSFDDDGCQTIRSNLATNEICAVTDIAIDAFDMIIAVGNCSAPNIGGRPFVARLTANGEYDIEFNGGIGVVFPQPPFLNISSQEYMSVVALPDGRIAALGEFAMTSENVQDLDLGMVQFDNGGGYDTTINGSGFTQFEFDVGGDNHDRARGLALRADGKLLALGEAKRTDTQKTVVLMAQRLPSGLPDEGFGAGGKRTDEADGLLGDNAIVSALELDDLGRAVISTSDVGVDERANSNYGTDFRFSFIYGSGQAYQPQLHVTALGETNCTITSPSLAEPFNFHIPAGSMSVVYLSDVFTEALDVDAVSSRGLQISADAPISVVARSGRVYSTDATVLTPTEHLGRRYRISSWGIGLGFGSTFSIAAVEDNTIVTITPSTTAHGHPAGTPYQVTLDANESYWTDGAGTNGDFTGTTIIANRPVAVMAGHTCAQIPDENVGNCENIFEQQTPIERWGTRFFAVPPINRPAGVFVRVLADHSPTKVWFDGTPVATLQAGQSHTSLRTSATSIVTSHPAFVTQLDTGGTFNTQGVSIGDPSLLVLEPISRWAPSQVARLVSAYANDDDQQQLLRIIAPTSVIHQIYINNTQLLPEYFSAIGNSGYSVAERQRGEGRHIVTGPLPISVNSSSRAGSESTTFNAAVLSANPSADDLILRLNANGTRDASFGGNGLALIDHTIVSGGNQNSHDRLIRALPLKDTIIAVTDFTSPTSAQHLPLAYRLAAGALFKDGFE